MLTLPFAMDKGGCLMSTAERSRRYRERQKALMRDATWTPEATVIMGILSALCDITGVVTPSALVDVLDEIEADGVAADCQMCVEWLKAVATLATVRH
jgi:hypothetical protein